MALSLRRKLLERGQLGQLAFIATQTDTLFSGLALFHSRIRLAPGNLPVTTAESLAVQYWQPPPLRTRVEYATLYM